MKFCSNCGRTYGDENEFCSECGTILKVKAAPSSNSNDSTSTQNPTENIIINSIQGNLSKIEGYSTNAYNEYLPLLKAPRIGQGVYAVAIIALTLSFSILSGLISYYEVDKLTTLINLASSNMRGFNGLPSLPSLTPFFALIILYYGSISFLLFKRLKDIGLSANIVQILTALFVVVAIYSIYTVDDSINTIITAALSGKSGGFNGIGGFMDLLDSASDIVTSIKLLTVLNISAYIAALIKSDPNDNHHGPQSQKI